MILRKFSNPIHTQMMTEMDVVHKLLKHAFGLPLVEIVESGVLERKIIRVHTPFDKMIDEETE